MSSRQLPQMTTCNDDFKNNPPKKKHRTVGPLNPHSHAGFNPYSYADPSTISQTDLSSVIAAGVSYPSWDDLQYCTEHNVVKNRGDVHFTHGAKDQGGKWSEYRPFSLTPEDFARHHNEECDSVSKIKNAIQYGERKWENYVVQKLPSMKREQRASHFVPDGCDVPYMSPAKVCDVLNRFSIVLFRGDSLTRHMRQGLFLTLNNDFVRGSIISTHDESYECRCDGQFSEAQACRLNDGKFDNMHPHELGLCSRLPAEGVFEYLGQQIATNTKEIRIDWSKINCAWPKFRGVLIVLQGGPHFGVDPELTYKEAILPVISHMRYKQCAEQGKAVTIWTSYGAQSRTLDTKYPHQSRENARVFNDRIEELLEGSGVITLDYWNFTADAQTSDGFHYLTDVNVFKIYYLLNLIEKVPLAT